MNKSNFELNNQMNYFQGKIVQINDGGFKISFFGRLGEILIPKRMLISDNEPKIGDVVGFMMTYPEVIEERKEDENSKRS
ncbi:MAG: CBO2463/CBO2479 domain-containing protein [Tissierellia bacterium]|nr:CBO2463/CBO2479 domain-containing protein [Tissierellia bacterium]